MQTSNEHCSQARLQWHAFTQHTAQQHSTTTHSALIVPALPICENRPGCHSVSGASNDGSSRRLNASVQWIAQTQYVASKPGTCWSGERKHKGGTDKSWLVVCVCACVRVCVFASNEGEEGFHAKSANEPAASQASSAVLLVPRSTWRMFTASALSFSPLLACDSTDMAVQKRVMVFFH